jgi:hypothetical protein
LIEPLSCFADPVMRSLPDGVFGSHRLAIHGHATHISVEV